MKLRQPILMAVLGLAAVCLLSSCMEMAIRSENWKSLALYGKVIDQYGNPVAGATVRGAIGINVSMVESGGRFVYTQTDAQGCFHFLHIHGAGIGIWPQKEGFYYNLKIPWQRPVDYQPDPRNPIIFQIWKIRGAENLVQSSLRTSLTPAGSAKSFKIASGAPANDGDLKITFMRTGDEDRPGLVHRFNWNIKIEVPDGGLIKEDDAYPFWAPDKGYQAIFEVIMTSNSPSWQSQVNQNFYIKNSSGKYGTMSLDVYSLSRPPEVHASFTMNPSGSQNLEPSAFPE
jgi:hypothetical protein